MNNADSPISPLLGQNGHTRLIDFNKKTQKSTYADGLTKREHFAGLAMQALLASNTRAPMESFANRAVGMADALLKELEKGKEK